MHVYYFLGNVVDNPFNNQRGIIIVPILQMKNLRFSWVNLLQIFRQ